MTSSESKPHSKLLLGRKLTLVVAVIGAVLASGYLMAGVWFAKIQLEREFQETAETFAASLSASLIESMFTYNLHEMPELLNNAQMANSNLVYGFVTDLEGAPVAHSSSLKQGVPGDLHLLAQSHALDMGKHGSWMLATSESSILHLSVPLEGRPGGYLHLGFSLERIDNNLQTNFRHLVSSMMLGLILSALIGGIIYQRMVKPIKELTHAAVDFGAGDLTRRVSRKEEVDDEVSLMAKAFNHMADHLQEKVTELEVSRSDLNDEKSRIQTILEGMMHGVVFYDPNGNITYCNSMARRYWGWSENDLPDSMETAHTEHPEVGNVFECVAMGIETGRPIRVRREHRIFNLFISSVKANKGGFLGIIEISADVTEQLASERALAHAEKLNVVGQLAAGVAHEINSPLDGAIEAARIIEQDDISREEINEFASAQRKALETIAIIVRRLLTFSRKEKEMAGSVSLWTVISDAVELVKYRLTNSSLIIQLPGVDEVPHLIEGEAIELSQVFVNLISNAIDVSPDGGKIRIKVTDRDNRVEVSITDQGNGIHKSSEQKLFTPFFTTKEVGKGTGLGLAISQNIMAQLGGRINFNNEKPPWGARFTVHIPWDGKSCSLNELKTAGIKG